MRNAVKCLISMVHDTTVLLAPAQRNAPVGEARHYQARATMIANNQKKDTIWMKKKAKRTVVTAFV